MFLLIVIFFGYNDFICQQKQKNRFYIICICVVWFIFASIRFGVGVDYFNYEQNFFDIKQGELTLFAYEPLEFWINSIVITSGLNYQWVVVIHAGLDSLLIYNILRRPEVVKYRSCASILFCTMFLFLDHLLMRQATAVLLATQIVFTRKLIVKLQWAILACLFHYSALIVFGVIFINKWLRGWISLLCFSVLAFFIGLNLESLMQNELLLRAFGPYATYNVDRYLTPAPIGSGLGVLAHLLLYFSALVYLTKDEPVVDYWPFVLMGLFFYILGLFVFIFSRFEFYFVPALLLAVSGNVTNNIKSNRRFYALIILATSMVLYIKDIDGYSINPLTNELHCYSIVGN